MKADDYNELKDETVMEQIGEMSNASKELTLFVTSARTDDHAKMSQRLVAFGYNIMVEMNNTMGRDFQVRYVNSRGDVALWNIPNKYLNAIADLGELKRVGKAKTGINSREDLSMPHILQAALFMGTAADARIREFAAPEEYLKLQAIYAALERPKDYPKKVRAALIAGNLASRGITFQNPAIDFTCTSFCFTDTRDAISRGAANTQRFGRACGMLGDVFARPGRQPILIATKGIVTAAVANEKAVLEKAKAIPNGELLALKEMIGDDEWKKIMNKSKKEIAAKNVQTYQKTETKVEDNTDVRIDGKIDGVKIAMLQKWIKIDCMSIVARIVRFLYTQNKRISP